MDEIITKLSNLEQRMAATEERCKFHQDCLRGLEEAVKESNRLLTDLDRRFTGLWSRLSLMGGLALFLAEVLAHYITK